MDNQERLLELNRRVLAEEPVSDEEYNELISSLRESRSAGSGKGTKNAVQSNLPDDINDLFKSE